MAGFRDILGLNFSWDASAALLREGRVLAAAAEERFDRVKHSGAFPHRAIDYCLGEAGTDLDGLDAVAFFWNPAHEMPGPDTASSRWRDHREYLWNVPQNLMGRVRDTRFDATEQVFHRDGAPPLRFFYVTHHRAHAASAFYPSPFKRAAVYVADGYGERASSTFAAGEGARLSFLAETRFPHSLGAFYAAFTEYLGFKPNAGEGKLMGLAPYGYAELYKPIREMLALLPDGGLELELSMFDFHRPGAPARYSPKLTALLGPPRAPEAPIDDRHKAIAASVQTVLEEALIHQTRALRGRTRLSNLCLAGGVALNCAAMGRILRESGFKRIFVQPAAGDSGAALGAALYVHHQLGGAEARERQRTDFHGPSYGADEVREAIARAGYAYTRPNDVARETARLLAEGKFLGWFQGRMEYGPRALGARSILADPRNAGARGRLNAEVKRREDFRPFAPAVLEERWRDFFDGPEASPFMSWTCRARSTDLPAVTHVDGSARVQTVSAERHPLFHRMIAAFGGMTSVPAVLNTSFNGRGEPIVRTPEDALRTFAATGLDALAIGPYLVEKPR
ncbi:MAG: hypothetical protein K8I02_07680 [Candidatus Methylomirabilis sp.]|nr:hypothetical protein [Deltaproteobacteria bacterium]